MSDNGQASTHLDDLRDGEIALEVKRVLIEQQRIVQWRNTVYLSTIDLKVARRYEDADLIAAAKASIAKAEKMIAGYEQELADLNARETETRDAKPQPQ